MEILSNGPAVLGSIMMSVALGSWSLGRWQRGLAIAEEAPPATGTAGGEAGEAPTARLPLSAAGPAPYQDAPCQDAPCQDAARAERRTALAAADSLGDLHAEISAYRRAQKVLAGPEGDGLRLHPLRADLRSECRYLGLMGEPTCGIARPVRGACTLGTRCSNADPLPPGPARTETLRQPSPAAAGLTRV